MTVVDDGRDVLSAASSDDRRSAVMDALELAGFTYDELADQARTGDFKSFDARLAWVVVGGGKRL